MATSPVIRKTPDSCEIICPRCQKGTSLPIAAIQAPKTSQHVRCDCGCILRIVRLDQRRHRRQPVQLSGTLSGESARAEMTPVMILDLSLSGIRFETDLSALKVGQRYRIAFRLDDASQTEIEDEIVIRLIHTDLTYGAEFINPTCQTELDFYLTTWGVQS